MGVGVGVGVAVGVARRRGRRRGVGRGRGRRGRRRRRRRPVTASASARRTVTAGHRRVDRADEVECPAVANVTSSGRVARRPVRAVVLAGDVQLVRDHGLVVGPAHRVADGDGETVGLPARVARWSSRASTVWTAARCALAANAVPATTSATTAAARQGRTARDGPEPGEGSDPPRAVCLACATRAVVEGVAHLASPGGEAEPVLLRRVELRVRGDKSSFIVRVGGGRHRGDAHPPGGHGVGGTPCPAPANSTQLRLPKLPIVALPGMALKTRYTRRDPVKSSGNVWLV